MIKTDNLNVLDFADGQGWVSEWLDRAGYNVTTFVIDPGIISSADSRIQSDTRIDSNRLRALV
jgi:2-polyprenyl-3-methyl-5-hydroxy-6-metoxy-1,4-benzoquinol methylase